MRYTNRCLPLPLPLKLWSTSPRDNMYIIRLRLSLSVHNNRVLAVAGDAWQAGCGNRSVFKVHVIIITKEH